MDPLFTAVVTGANSGVGLALCERLLTQYPKLKLCMVCRNKQKGESAKNALLVVHPDAVISLVIGDVSSIVSVKQFTQEIKQQFSHINFLFLNAGIMANPKVKFETVISTLFQPSKLVHRFSTGADLLEIADDTTKEGFKMTFATNVFGHFCMVKELDDVLGGEEPSRIVWTSSRTSSREVFSVADIQHTSGRDPYASSKYLIDSLSVVMNDKLRAKNITTNTTCPGLTQSGISLGILPWWFWYLILPIIKLLRLFVPSFTWEPYNGAEALIWLTTQKPSALDPLCKYYSMCTVLGRAYTSTAKIDVDMMEAENCYQQLEELLRNFKPVPDVS
ncbi:HSD17B7 [Bugula neritina]|uniref:HSD17B7 n=1 Tax=Bugula neritina TaxID=10212 RepID=A0A7J7J076_BUGNE|nr:HSD17B7 [Bugula neritina]